MFIKNFFNFPPKKKYLIVHESGSEVLFRSNIIKHDETFILDLQNYRFLNFWSILYGIIFNLKIIKKSKYTWVVSSFIKIVKPHYVITFMDYIIGYYYLKKYNSKPKYLSIQVGRRNNEPGQFFSILKKTSSKYELSCDYILTYSKDHAIEYSKYINCKAIHVGSVRSNSYNLSNKVQSVNSILFISQYRSKHVKNDTLITYEDKKISHKDFFLAETYLLKIILKFCKIKNLKLKILSSLSHLDKEALFFFENILGKNNFEYLIKSDDVNSYEIVDSHKFVCGVDSTLLYEALARKSRVGVFYLRKCFIPALKDVNFGWPSKLDPSGKFWTDCCDEKEIFRVLDNILKLSDNDWSLNTKNVISNVMQYDERNQILKSILNND